MRLNPIVAAFAVAMFPVAALGTVESPLVTYRPDGFQCSNFNLVASFTKAGVSSASVLSQVGLPCCACNTGAWPTGGPISNSPTIELSQYQTFTVEFAKPTPLSSLTYNKTSYFGNGPRNGSVRSSLDGFASDIDMVSGLPQIGKVEVVFDLSSLGKTSGPVEFRIYWWNATGFDWADLDIRVGGGLVLNGIMGACCDSADLSSCTDNVLENNCQGPKHEWHKGERCADVDCTENVIPAVTEWGIASLVLLLLAGLTVKFRAALPRRA